MTSDALNGKETDPEVGRPPNGGGRRYSGRVLGIVPNSRRNRVFFAWACANFVLTFLPVWDVAFNSERMVGGILPVGILWSYLVFASNMALGITFYLAWARGWAADADARQQFTRASGPVTPRPYLED